MSGDRLIIMRPDELVDFVRNKAKPGDVATTYNTFTKQRYIYCCSDDNIGPDAKPMWFYFDERELLARQLKSMTLEERVNFLINRYVEGV